jgi:peroxiredoxin Q/BCP
MSDTGVPQVGQKAPSFAATASTGPIALDDFKGRKLVLYFYPKADTAG